MSDIRSAVSLTCRTTAVFLYWAAIKLISIFGVAIYFLMVKPQKKEQQKMAALQNSVEAGDSVLTTSGFYGVVIGVELMSCFLHSVTFVTFFL